jgi:peptidoglycan/xylan/chitin deacetylase (PgdA/CDA1 family)
VLDILAEYDIKATFFVIGHDNEFAHSMYRRIVQEGHAIGNHTYSHDYSRIYSSQANFLKDFYRLEDLLDRVIGIRPRIMRFPGGSNNQSSSVHGGSGFMKGMTQRMRNEGYSYYDWNVSSEDSASRTPPAADIIQAVKSRVRNKNQVMILFHDSAAKTTTVEALPEIIEYLRKEGFAFRAIDQDTPGFRF